MVTSNQLGVTCYYLADLVLFHYHIFILIF